MSVVDRLARPRIGRLIQFASIGVLGAGVDLVVTLGLLGYTHYLVANVAGFLVAVSHNFIGNWWLTYSRPDGSIPRQYLSYVGLHSVTFAARAIVLTTIVEAVGVPAGIGTVIGVGVAAMLNFVGVEWLFSGDGSVAMDAVGATNHIAHAVYSSRLRRWLQVSGLYGPVFAAYTLGVSIAYPASKRRISVGSANAELATEKPTETVSVLHSLEKEQDILELFVADVRPTDHVLDVGANVGIYSALALDIGATVSAVEPHTPTAERLRHNCPGATVHELALGAESGEMQLAIERDKPGTQRPTVSSDGGQTVNVVRGDSLRQPDVVKIDVEGGEEDVLRGLSASLPDARVVYVECHNDRLTQTCRSLLSQAGLVVETVSDGRQIYLRASDDPGNAGERQTTSNNQ